MVIMSVNKAKTPTNDGKCWFFRVPYRDEFNTIKQYNSKKYATRAEAKEAELEYLNKLKENINVPIKMTIEDLWNAFLEYPWFPHEDVRTCLLVPRPRYNLIMTPLRSRIKWAFRVVA